MGAKHLLQCMQDEIEEVIAKDNDKIMSIGEVVGCLEMIKFNVILDVME